MAEIRDELVLEIDQALRQINQIEGALDRALAPVQVKVEVDASEAEAMESTLREIERIAERASTETSAMALAAGRAEVNFEDVARALNISEDEARKLTREILESQAAANRLEDASRDVARQLGLSDTEANRLVRSLNAADRAAESIDVTTLGLGQRFAALRSSVGGIASVLAGLGGAAILGGALVGSNAAIQSFARLEDSINAVNVVFGSASAGVRAFGETAAASAGLSAEAFNQAVVPIGSLLQNFGFDAQQAAEGAVVLVQRAADLASVMGGSVQDALLAVGAALRGEADPLERYGASISAARVEQFALAEGLAKTKAELTPALLLQARYGLILSDTSRVAGDFANTADDLANAQRSAGAAVQNFVTDIGEELAPALETILVLLPEMLEGVRQLVPAFAAGADSAADFFESIGEGGGFRTEFATTRAAVESIFSPLGLLGEQFALVGDIARVDMGAARDTIERVGDTFQRVVQRAGALALARQLDAGADAADAFGSALQGVARGSASFAVFTDSFEQFAVAANLTKLELRDVTVELIENADTVGLTAEEVAFLVSQLALLNSELFTDIEAVREFNRIQRELGDGLPEVASRFVSFAGETETAQERASNALTQLANDAEAQATRTAAAFDLFAELPEKITGSFTAAVDALRAQVEASFDFDVNLAILRALNLDALADEFADQGIAAAGQLAQAVNDIPEAIEADRLLQGFSDLGTDAFNALVKQFIDAGLTPADAQRLARTLSSPEVIAAAEEAGRSVGAAQAESYHSRLTEDLDQLIPEIGESIGRSVETHWVLEEQADTAARDTAQSYVDGIIGFNIDDRIQEIFESVSFVVNLFDVGADSASSYVAGFQEELASRQDAVTSAITGTLDTAIQRDSPPKLFLDAGKESGAAFWSGFEEAGLGPLRTPETGVTGTMVNSTAAANTGNGINVNLTTINPIQQDEVSDVARMGQIASSVAASYRSVVPNGM